MPAEPSLARQDVLQMRSASMAPVPLPHSSKWLLSWRYIFLSSNEKLTKQLLSSTVEILQLGHLNARVMAEQIVGECIV